MTHNNFEGPIGGPFLHNHIEREDAASSQNQGGGARRILLPADASLLLAGKPLSNGGGGGGGGGGGEIKAEGSKRQQRDGGTAEGMRAAVKGLVLHSSRCGSTLLANAFRNLGVTVLSEPEACNSALSRHLTKRDPRALPLVLPVFKALAAAGNAMSPLPQPHAEATTAHHAAVPARANSSAATASVQTTATLPSAASAIFKLSSWNVLAAVTTPPQPLRCLLTREH